ncbi:hypothetical protein Nmel_017191, partial [Mimus melanotis]
RGATDSGFYFHSRNWRMVISCSVIFSVVELIA